MSALPWQNLGLAVSAAWAKHVDVVLGDRGDEHRKHGSDLHACDLATWLRIHGIAQLPADDDAFAMFERGHAYEARIHDALVAHFLPLGFSVTRGEEVERDGIVGHLDFAIYPGASEQAAAVIDVSTTAGKTADWKYGHALKTAWYATVKGAPRFAEIVVRIGFGGIILELAVYEWSLDDEPFKNGVTWRQHVAMSAAHLNATADSPLEPDAVPPIDPRKDELETWRCGRPGSGKSYCRAQCPRNARRS